MKTDDNAPILRLLCDVICLQVVCWWWRSTFISSLIWTLVLMEISLMEVRFQGKPRKLSCCNNHRNGRNNCHKNGPHMTETFTLVPCIHKITQRIFSTGFIYVLTYTHSRTFYSSFNLWQINILYLRLYIYTRNKIKISPVLVLHVYL
jgi:hypothetical protein